MQIYAIAIIFLFFHCISYPQLINIKVENLNDNKALLSFLEGENISFIDTVTSGDEDTFKFNFDESKYHPGFFRLSFNNNKWIDFIFDKEEVTIKTDANNILDSLAILKSESNKIYYDFIKLNNNYKTKTEMLQLILARYPKQDDFYKTTRDEIIQVQEDYLNFVNITSQASPNSFIARYVRSAQILAVETDIPLNEQLTFLKTHSFDNVNFNDDGLIYSDVFTNKTIEYLTYYRNPQIPKKLLEMEFMIAVDTILNKAKVNEIIYQHVVEYLIDGFKKFGFDNVIDYIVDNYVIKDNLCLDKKLGDTIERKIQQARNFKVGSIVPNIFIQDSSGSLIELNKINADRTLIIFYASWCPHCQTLLPQVYDLYNSQEEKKFEVITISIDTSRVDWLQFIRTNNLDWVNVSDLEGWDGQSTKEYFIYATPTMFLVDKSKNLIAKPSSIDELSDWF